MNSRVRKLLIRLGIALVVLFLTLSIQYIENKTDEVQDSQKVTKDDIATGDNVTARPLAHIYEQDVLVTRVVDGDTIYIQNEEMGEIKVRLIGIQAPEINHPTKGRECLGEEARVFAQQTLLNTYVIFSQDDSQDITDQYQRFLGYVVVGGNDFGELLIKEGLAQEYTYRRKYEKQGVYRDAQDIAQASNVGLWGETCQ